MSAQPQPRPPSPAIGATPVLEGRRSVPLGAILMGAGGAVGIWAASSPWWTVGFQLESAEELAADLGGVAGVATTAGRIAAVGSLVAVMAAAGSLGTMKAGLRRRLGALVIGAAFVVVATAAFMAARGGDFPTQRADLAARAQDLSDAEDLSAAAREFAPGAEITMEVDVTPALMIQAVSAIVAGLGGVLLVRDPLGTGSRRVPTSHP